jgi:hypothetical protein
MKQILLAFFTCAHLISFSQTVKLRSGHIQPANNTSSPIDFSNWQAYQFQQNTYCIIQFSEATSPLDREKVSVETGIQFFDYIPQQAFLASIPNTSLQINFSEYKIRSVIPYLGVYKIHPILLEKPIKSWMQHAGGKISILLESYSTLSKSDILENLGKNNIAVVKWKSDFQCEVLIAENSLSQIANLPWVKYLQAPSAPIQYENLVERTNHRINTIDADYLTGLQYDGVNNAIAVGDDGNVGPHIDFKGRLTFHPNTLASGGTHGDHVAGIAAGGGNFDPVTSGNARGAQLHIYQGFANIDSAANNYLTDNIRVTVNSLGQTCNGGYDADAVMQDQLILDLPSLLSVHSAGNSGGTVCSPVTGGYFTITGGYKAAKNSIAVGNVRSDDVLAPSSSKGPSQDGRIKPEVVAVGSNVYSTQPDNTYDTFSGTSMAAPAVSGLISSLLHAFNDMNGFEPSNALMKCIVMASADDLGNKGPDYSYGFGRINARRAYNMIKESRYIEDVATQGNFNVFTVTPSATTKQIKVTLYWNDIEASASSSDALVNDLDLLVLDPDGTTYSAMLLNNAPDSASLSSTATIDLIGLMPDTVNNVEQIILDSTQNNPLNLDYTFVVFGSNIPFGPQRFAIGYEFIEDDVTLTYPNGGEKWVNGKTERIRWDAWNGGTDPFELSYSTDAGATWNVLATGLPAASRFYDWTLPTNVFSGEMLISIKKGAASDISDSMFNLFTVPTNLRIDSACKSTFYLAWDTIPNATSYDIHSLMANYMEPITTVTGGLNYMYVTGVNVIDTFYYAVSGNEPTKNTKGQRTLAYTKFPGEINCVDIDNMQTILPFDFAYDCALTGPLPIKVKLKNVGMRNVLGVPIRYQINAGPIITEYYPNIIQPGDSIIYTFNTLVNFSLPNTYNVKTWVDITFDNVLANDTSISTCVVFTPVQMSIPSLEDFEGAIFPPSGWRVLDYDTSVKWQKTLCFSGANAGNTHAAYMDNFNYTEIYKKDDLESNHVNLNGVTQDSVILSFDYAYANHPSKIDTLELLVSNDCAASFSSLPFKRWGSNLATTTSMTTNFSPTLVSQWKNAKVNLTNYKGQKIFLRFRGMNSNGNNVFVDNINIYTKNYEPLSIDNYSLSDMIVYPNPSDGNYILEVNASESKKLQYAIYTATGQLVKRHSLQIEKGNTRIGLNISEQAGGVYHLEINDGMIQKNIKITKY